MNVNIPHTPWHESSVSVVGFAVSCEDRSMTPRCLASVMDAPTRPAKLFNFLFHGGYGVFYFYQPLLLKRRGVPASLLGVVLGVRPLVSTLATPLWSAAADKFDAHRTLLLIGLTFGSCSRILFCIVPTDPIWMLTAAIVSESLICHVVPLGDAAVFVKLARLGRPRQDYALQRLWGAIAAAFFLPVAGALLTVNSRGAAWSIVLGLSIGTLWLNGCVVPALFTVKGSGMQSPSSMAATDPNAKWRALCRMRISPRGLVRTCLLFACGAFHAVTEGFLFAYLDDLGAPELLAGLAITVTCTSETAVMALSGWLLRRHGVDVCLACVVAGYAIRFLGYAYLQPMPHTWWVLAFQTLHGLTFGLYWTVGTTCAAECAPRGLEATLQGAFTTLISAGQTLALIGGGYLYEHHGGAMLYEGACITAAGVLLVAVSLALASPRRSQGQRERQWTSCAPRAQVQEEGDAALTAGALRSDANGTDVL